MCLMMERYSVSDALANYLIRKGGISMYINPFLAGILFTVAIEAIAAVLWALWKGRENEEK